MVDQYSTARLNTHYRQPHFTVAKHAQYGNECNMKKAVAEIESSFDPSCDTIAKNNDLVVAHGARRL